jgi:hypothetical protein
MVSVFSALFGWLLCAVFTSAYIHTGINIYIYIYIY